MYKLKGEDLIPGLTMDEIKKSRLPLPERDSLDVEEQQIMDDMLARSKRFFESVPANAGQEYRLTPYFQGLLQSPRVAKLWASFGDFYQPAEKRGSFSHRERELAELTVGMLLKLMTGTRSLPAVHVADAVGVGLAPTAIKAIYEDRFEDFGDRATRDPDTGRYRVDEDGDGTPDYQFRDPDFNVRDWNSNLVLRWQYSPGSSLFLVWSQNRSSFAPDGSFSVDRDLDALFGEQPRDVFLVKINRWFDL